MEIPVKNEYLDTYILRLFDYEKVEIKWLELAQLETKIHQQVQNEGKDVECSQIVIPLLNLKTWASESICGGIHIDVDDYMKDDQHA